MATTLSAELRATRYTSRMTPVRTLPPTSVIMPVCAVPALANRMTWVGGWWSTLRTTTCVSDAILASLTAYCHRQDGETIVEKELHLLYAHG